MTKNPYKRLVKEVLTRETISVHADATLDEALRLMVGNRVSALPIVDREGGCQGIMSTTDVMDLVMELDDELHDLGRVAEESTQWLIDKLSDHDLTRRTVQEVMTTSVMSISGDETLLAAAQQMVQHHVHRLPVTNGKGQLMGIVSTIDVLRAFVAGAPGE